MRKSGLVQGQYKPVNPMKYNGKVPIIYRSSWELRLCKFFDNNENVIKWTSESVVVPYYNPITQRTHRYFPDFTVEYYDREGCLIKEMNSLFLITLMMKILFHSQNKQKFSIETANFQR